jgi:hypothetical protein
MARKSVVVPSIWCYLRIPISFSRPSRSSWPRTLKYLWENSTHTFSHMCARLALARCVSFALSCFTTFMIYGMQFGGCAVNLVLSTHSYPIFSSQYIVPTKDTDIPMGKFNTYVFSYVCKVSTGSLCKFCVTFLQNIYDIWHASRCLFRPFGAIYAFLSNFLVPVYRLDQGHWNTYGKIQHIHVLICVQG